MARKKRLIKKILKHNATTITPPESYGIRILQQEGDFHPSSYNSAFGKYLNMEKDLKSRYKNGRINLKDLYNYYMKPLSIYTVEKIRSVLIAMTLSVTVYLTCNIYHIKTTGFLHYGFDFSTITLILGGLFVVKEIVGYFLRLKKMMDLHHFYKGIFGISPECMKLSQFVECIIRLEKDVNSMEYTPYDVKLILSYEDRLMRLLIQHRPSLFTLTSSKFYLNIIKKYLKRIQEYDIKYVSDELVCFSLLFSLLLPAIFLFTILYYTVKVIEKSQFDLSYLLLKVYKPTFRYTAFQNPEYPHVTRAKMKKSAKYLNEYFTVREGDPIVYILSSISFVLSCGIFLIVLVMVNTLYIIQPPLMEIFNLKVSVMGIKISFTYLTYFLGFLSFILKCMNLKCAKTSRRKILKKWAQIMKKRGIGGFYMDTEFVKLYTDQFSTYRTSQIFLEIFSTFLIPFQMINFRSNIREIELLFEENTLIDGHLMMIEKKGNSYLIEIDQ